MGTQIKRERLQRDGVLHPSPERVTVELLSLSEFFDAADLLQMKYEMLRAVEFDKMQVADAAQAFGLSRVAYYRARRQYEQSGLAGLLPHKRGPKGPHKITAEVLEFTHRQITESEGDADWEELCSRIEKAYGVLIHPRSLERAMARRPQQ